MRALLLIPIYLLTLTSPAYAAPAFKPYIAKDAKREGDGGERTVVQGMEIWSNGAPPRRFEILGYLTDSRHSTGLFGVIRMASLEKEIVKAARDNGGDALIVMSESAEVVGTRSVGTASVNAYGTGYNSVHASGWGSSFSTTIEKQNGRYAVIRYLDDGSVTSPSVGAQVSMPSSAPVGAVLSKCALDPSTGAFTKCVPTGW